jgi:histidinol-phosphate aminotransferase
MFATTRRSFLRTLSLGAAAGTALQWPLAGVSRAGSFEPARVGEPGGPIRLNSNENAYGPSKKTMAAIVAATARSNRYPFMEYDPLVERIASAHGVKSEQVLLGCGSTEILRVATAAFTGSDRQLVQASPTFESIGHYASMLGAEVVSVPLAHGFAHDLDGMLARVGASSGLVYICNPNNPTASITPRKDLETFIGKLPANCYVLIDEAYHHYVSPSGMYASFIDRPVDDKRVIVSRTFSKVYGLAGLRLGYAVGSPATLERMRAHTTEDNVNGIVARAAVVALEDREATREFAKRNADDRQEFLNHAQGRMIKPIDPHANFVMFDTHDPATDIIEHFRKNNILIGRRFPPMDTYIRVSLGTPNQMLAFWRIWDTLPYPKGAMQH